MIGTEKPPLEATYLAHISFRPWSSYKEADYTPEQWHRACLIHLHDGAPTSKSQCKLPVRTPNGAVNKNGVHAAKAALNGARGGVSAPDSEKTKARAALSRLDGELEKKVPAFLAKHGAVNTDDLVVEHFGVRGMKWGVRRGKKSTGVSRVRGALIDRNARQAQRLHQAKSGKGIQGKFGNVGRLLLGQKRWARMYNTSIKEMKAQDKRLRSGKLTVFDRLTLMMTTTPVSLLVTVRPD